MLTTAVAAPLRGEALDGRIVGIERQEVMTVGYDGVPD